jgi:hypothetical protein
VVIVVATPATNQGINTPLCKELNFNKTVSYDMATVSKMVQPFEGKPDQDIATWIRDAKLVARVGDLNEIETLKIIIWSLRGAALSWASGLLEKTPGITLAQFCAALESRFASKQAFERILKRFLYSASISTLEQFNTVLRDAAYLHDKGHITGPTLAQIIISKVPDVLKHQC